MRINPVKPTVKIEEKVRYVVKEVVKDRVVYIDKRNLDHMS